MAEKKDKSGLGTLRRTPRDVFTPGNTESSEQSALADEIRKQGENISKTIDERVTSAVAAVTGSATKVFDLISDNISESLSNTEELTYQLYEMLGVATDKNHILGQAMPKDWFETVKSSVYQTGQAFDTVNKNSYASIVSSHLINIESAVYAVAAAFWGWDKAKKGQEMDTNIKSLSKEITDPVVGAAKSAVEIFDKLKKAKPVPGDTKPGDESATVDGKNQTMFFDKSLLWQSEQTGLLKEIISSIKDNNKVSTASVVSAPSVKEAAAATKSETKAAARDGGVDGRAVTGSQTKNLKETLDIIKNIESLPMMYGGKKGKKTIKKFFKEYGSSIDLIIDECININKKLADVETVDSSNVVRTMLEITELLAAFSEENTKELRKNIKNARKLLVGDTKLSLKQLIRTLKKSDDKSSDNTLIGFTYLLKNFTNEASDVLSGIKVDGKAQGAARAVSELFNIYKGISDNAAAAPTFGIVSFIDRAKNVVNPALQEFAKSLGETSGGVKGLEDSSNAVKSAIDSLSGLGKSYANLSEELKLKTVISLYIKLSLYSGLTNEINSFAATLNRVNGKVQSFDDFNTMLDGSVFTTIAKLNGLNSFIDIKKATRTSAGVEKYKTLIENIMQAASDMKEAADGVSDKDIDEVCGKNGKLIKIGLIGKAVNEINSSFKKSVVTSAFGALGAKMSKKTIKAVSELVKELVDKDFLNALKTAADEKDGTVTRINAISKSLFKVMLYGSLLAAPAITASVSFGLTVLAMKAVKKAVTTLASIDTDTMLVAIDNIQSLLYITKETGKVMLLGTLMGVTAVPAAFGFLVAALAVLSAHLFVKTLASIDTDTMLAAMDNIQSILYITKETGKVMLLGTLTGVMAVPAAFGFLLTAAVFKFALKPLLFSIIDIFNSKKHGNADPKEFMFKLHALASITTSLMKICVSGAVLAVTAVPALLGFVMVRAVLKLGIKKVLNTVLSIFGKEDSGEYVKAISQIKDITYSLCKVCAAGALLLVFAPLALAGFAIVMPALLVLSATLTLIHAIVGDSDSEHSPLAAAKDLGILVLTLAGVMVVGGMLGGVVMKLMPNIIIFTLALSFFIFSIVTAISIATVFGGGLKHLEHSAKAIQRIVIMSSLIMIAGGLIVMLMPKIITNAFVFTFLLAAFLFTVVGSITLGAKAMKGSEKSLVYIMAYEIVTAAVLLVPGYILSKNPDMWFHIAGFIALGALLSFGLAKLARYIGKHAKDFAAATPVMYAMTALMVGMGAMMVELAFAAKTVDGHGDALLGVSILMVSIVGATAWAIKALGKSVKVKELLAGSLVIGAAELCVAGMAGLMFLLNKVAMSITDWGQFGLAVGVAFGIVGAAVVAITLIGAAAAGPAGAFFWAGAGVIAATEACVLGMTACLFAMSEASKKKINEKNLASMLESFKNLAFQMADMGLGPVMIFKIAQTTAAMATMGYAISKIAEGVAEASNMHYTKYENGKKVGEFNLSDEDFSRAAQNTKTVVSVLGNAIIDIYKENPEIFSTGTILGDIIGTETKFEKVCGSVSMLGKVISKIAKGVANMANLHFTKYENGKEAGEFNIGQAEFKAAADNTKLVVKTLGTAIMDAYNSNPEIFTANGSGGNFLTNTLGAVAGFFGADTKFAKVAKSMMCLGNLISSLSKGVSDMANLTVTEYDKDGKEKKRNMNMSDFVLAAANTDFIVTWLANTIIKVYEAHPDLFTSGSGVGDALGFNPKFKNIIDTVSALGGLMSNIAGGVQAMANNSMPVYGKNGEIIRKDPIKPEWYGQAAVTVTNVITTMGNAIMKVYDEHKDWFTNWIGATSDSNAFTSVMHSCSNMAEMMGKYVEIVNQYASGKVDIYGPDGKVLTSMPIGQKQYNEAASNVTSVISTLASSVFKTYNDNKGLFDEDTFEPLMDNLDSLSELLSKYSNKVKDFANLTYDEYDSQGKVIGKHSIGQPEFEKAGKAVTSIISTLVTGIYEAYNGKGADGTPYSKLFEDTNADPRKKGSGETWFGRIINSFLSVSPLISSMSKAVQEYATLQVPEYDGAGVATGRKVKMTDKTFEEAANSVSKIITSLVGAVGTVWADQNNQTLFTNASSWGSGQKDNSNPFYIISTALNAAAKMVNDSAVATKNVLSIPGFENPEDIKSKLDTRIPVMTSALVNAVVDAYNKGNKERGNIFDDALSDNSPFKKVAVAMQSAYEVVDKSTKVYENVSKMDMTQMDKVTGTGGDISSNKIYRMIKGLAEPIIEIYTSGTKGGDGKQVQYKDLFYKPGASDSYFTRIKDGIKGVADIMGAVKSAYQSIADAGFDVNEIAGKIKEAILGLINPIGTAYSENKGAFDDAAPLSGMFATALSALNPLSFVAKYFIDKNKPADTPAQRVIQALSGISGVMDGIAKAYKSIADIPFDKKTTGKKMTDMITGLVDVFKNVDADFDDAEDKADDMKDFVESMSEVLFGDMEDGEFGGILSVYEKMQSMKIGSQAIANNMGLRVKRLVEGIVNAVSVPVEFDAVAAHDSFLTMQRSVNTIIDIYKAPADMLQPVMASYGATDMDTLVKNATDTIKSIPTKLGEMMNDGGGMFSDKGKLDSFVAGAWKMKLGIGNLSEGIALIPQSRDIDYFIPYINKLNKEISTIPKLDEFIKETDNLVRFNSSVNSLQVRNVEVLTKLFIEFNKFSSKFGNLDKFTQVLATKMAQCLTYLADQIKASAKTIDKADEMQKKRQEQIRKTIEEFRKLADQGLEVTVKAAETEAGSGSFSGGEGGSDTSAGAQQSVQSQSLGNGSSSSREQILQNINNNVWTICRHFKG